MLFIPFSTALFGYNNYYTSQNCGVNFNSSVKCSPFAADISVNSFYPLSLFFYKNYNILIKIIEISRNSGGAALYAQIRRRLAAYFQNKGPAFYYR